MQIFFSKDYHFLQSVSFALKSNPVQITKTSYQFIQLINNYRMTYYTDNKTNHEL